MRAMYEYDNKCRNTSEKMTMVQMGGEIWFRWGRWREDLLCDCLGMVLQVMFDVLRSCFV